MANGEYLSRGKPMFFELDKLRDSLAPNQAPEFVGECEGCNRVGNLWNCGPYLCAPCRERLRKRIEEEKHIGTGRPLQGSEKPGGDGPKAYGNPGPFGTARAYMPRDPFNAFAAKLADPFGTFQHTAAMGENPLTTQEQVRRTQELHEEWLEEARNLPREIRQRRGYTEDEWRESTSRYLKGVIPPPASGASSTPPRGAPSVSAGAKGTAAPSFASYLESQFSRVLAAYLNSSVSGSSTGQPSLSSSMSTGARTRGQDSERWDSIQAQMDNAVSLATAWPPTEPVATWPLPEDESKPIIGQILPLDSSNER